MKLNTLIYAASIGLTAVNVLASPVQDVNDDDDVKNTAGSVE